MSAPTGFRNAHGADPADYERLAARAAAASAPDDRVAPGADGRDGPLRGGGAGSDPSGAPDRSRGRGRGARRRLRRGRLCRLGPLVSADHVAEIRAFLADKPLAYYDAQDRPLGRGRGDTWPESAFVGYFDHGDLADCPHLLDVANHPLVIDLATRHLGFLPILDNIVVWRSRAGQESVASPQVLHRDKDCLRFCKLFVYLCDVDEESGPHVFLPGSHRIDRFTELLADAAREPSGSGAWLGRLRPGPARAPGRARSARLLPRRPAQQRRATRADLLGALSPAARAGRLGLPRQHLRPAQGPAAEASRPPDPAVAVHAGPLRRLPDRHEAAIGVGPEGHAADHTGVPLHQSALRGVIRARRARLHCDGGKISAAPRPHGDPARQVQPTEDPREPAHEPTRAFARDHLLERVRGAGPAAIEAPVAQAVEQILGVALPEHALDLPAAGREHRRERGRREVEEMGRKLERVPRLAEEAELPRSRVGHRQR